MQNKKKIAQASSLTSSRNHLIETGKYAKCCSKSEVFELFLSRNNSIHAVFSVLVAPSDPFPHLCPQRCNTCGGAVRGHSPQRIQGRGMLRPAPLISYILSPLPSWSSISSVPTCWLSRTQLALVCLYLWNLQSVLMSFFSNYKSHTCSSLHKSQILQKCVFFENMSLHPSKPYTDFAFVLNKKQSL